MWFLPSRGRPGLCQKTLDACVDTQMSSPGVVYVDRRAGEYLELKLPSNWTMVVGDKDLAPAKQEFYEQHPDEKFYGLLCDDLIPRTDYFDQAYEEAAGDWCLVECNDAWPMEKDEEPLGYTKRTNALMKGLPPPLSGAYGWGAKLVHTVGWWSLPGIKQFGTDNAWVYILNAIGNPKLRKYLNGVIVEHCNFRIGKRDKDATDDWMRDGLNYRDPDLLIWERRRNDGTLKRIAHSVLEAYTADKAYNFDEQKEVWEEIPFLGRKRTSKELLTWSLDSLRHLVENGPSEVYAQESHRDGKFRRAFYEQESDPEFKHVYDFGCGCGFFALELCRKKYRVSLADIRADNLQISKRVLEAFGFDCVSTNLITRGGRDFPICKCDIFHSVGVLHHTPFFREILLRAVKCLNPGGEIWLMLYSDNLLRKLTGSEPNPIDQPIEEYPNHQTFVTFDPVGCYVDWYDKEKIEFKVGDFLETVYFEYVGLDAKHLVVKLRPK